MTRSANDPAFPRPASKGTNYLSGEPEDNIDPQDGMTIREVATFAAMVSLGAYYSHEREIPGTHDLAKDAVKLADSTLRTLGYDVNEGGS